MEDEQEGQEGSEIPIEDEGGDERSEGGWSDATTLVLGEHNPEERDELDDSENEMPPLMNGGSPVASPASPGGGDGASEDGSSESVVMSPKDTKNEWKEELFQTPPDFKGSLRRHELIEMCVALMQFLGEKHPDILKNLVFFHNVLFDAFLFGLTGSCVARPTS